jgi:hypothetical protein
MLSYNRKNACPLLNGLQCGTHDGPTTKVERPRVPASHNNVQVVVALMSGLGNDGVKLCNLLSELGVIRRKVATKLLKDLDSISAASIGD